MNGLYIPAHVSLLKSPKVRRLARLLDVPRPAAVGYLIFLWHYTLDQAPETGDLSKSAPIDIAEECEWTGVADDFIAALQEAGFLDGLRIHDWHDYLGPLLDRRARDAERQRRRRASDGRPRDVRVTSDGHPRDVRVTSDGRPGDREEKRREDKTKEENSSSSSDLAREDEVPQPQRPPEDESQIAYRAWEHGMGSLLTPLVAENIDNAILETSLEWVLDAIKESAEHNAKGWKYTNAILQRWKREGRNAVVHANGARASPPVPAEKPPEDIHDIRERMNAALEARKDEIAEFDRKWELARQRKAAESAGAQANRPAAG